MTRIRRRFNISTKKRILDEQAIDDLSDCVIAARYDLEPSQIARWKKKINEIQLTSETKKSLNKGRKPQFIGHEDTLDEYIIHRLETRKIINIRILIAKLDELNQTFNQKSLKAKQKYIYRFLKRKNLFIRRITPTQNVKEEVLHIRFEIFLEKVRNTIVKNINLIFINMDQTSVNYDMPERTSVTYTGSASVTVREKFR
jgi:hypothetical protein